MGTVKECLITGQTNVGKTLLLLNFAEYCGVQQVQLTMLRPGADTPEAHTMSLSRARAQLVGPVAHQTRQLQYIELKLPKGKGKRRFRLLDSAGLVDTIHDDKDVRLGMAQTLRALRQAWLVLHVIDAAAVGRADHDGALSEIDLQISRYAPLRSPYLIVANKIDLPWAPPGLVKIRQYLSHHPIVPVSALERTGFREVKAFVWDHL